MSPQCELLHFWYVAKSSSTVQRNEVHLCPHSRGDYPRGCQPLCPFKNIYLPLSRNGCTICDHCCVELDGWVPWPCVLCPGGYHQYCDDFGSGSSVCCLRQGPWNDASGRSHDLTPWSKTAILEISIQHTGPSPDNILRPDSSRLGFRKMRRRKQRGGNLRYFAAGSSKRSSIWAAGSCDEAVCITSFCSKGSR